MMVRQSLRYWTLVHAVAASLGLCTTVTLVPGIGTKPSAGFDRPILVTPDLTKTTQRERTKVWRSKCSFLLRWPVCS
jgi:hypothetical protein